MSNFETIFTTNQLFVNLREGLDNFQPILDNFSIFILFKNFRKRLIFWRFQGGGGGGGGGGCRDGTLD